MRFLPYILKHLRRNWIRTASTVAAMALCVFLICVLQTVLAGIQASLDSTAPDRLVVRHSVSLVFDLPVAYKARIEGVPGVRRVAVSDWFGGLMGSGGGRPDFRNFFPNFAVEPESYFALYPEYVIPPDQFRAFVRDQRGAVIGPDLAAKYGWTIGSTFQLESIIPQFRLGRPFEFIVRAIYDVDTARNPGLSRQVMFFNWKYLYEATGQRTGAGTYYVQVENASQAGAVAKAIDALFENSDVQTRTEPEGTFIAGFYAQAGNLVLLLNFVGLAVAFTILLVTANTMSMAVRERRTEIAVLKTLGFSSGLVLALVLGEALVLGLAGGGLGVALAEALVANIAKVPGLGAVLGGFLPSPELSPGVATAMLAGGAGIGLASGLGPAVTAYRASITAMLRQV